MYLDTDIKMDVTYVYYLLGTIILPRVINTYRYLGIEPSADLGLQIKDNVVLRYTSEQKKLVDTLMYLSLSIKGIAIVSQSLDIYSRVGDLLLYIDNKSLLSVDSRKYYAQQGGESQCPDALQTS